jgi:hypothetical protein
MKYPDLMKLEPFKKTRVVRHVTGFATVYQVQYTFDGHQWTDWGNPTTLEDKALGNAECLIAPRTIEVVQEFEP